MPDEDSGATMANITCGDLLESALDHVIQNCMAEPSLEFVWVGDDAVDPLEQAQTLNILVAAGIKTREEARADWGWRRRAGRGRRPTTLRQRHCESSIRTTTNAGSSRRRTGLSPPWAA